MTDERRLDLLIDLVKLVRKYGPDSFDELAEYLSSQTTTHDLPQVLTKVAQMVRSLPERKEKEEKKQVAPIPKTLLSIKRLEHEKYQLLKPFYDELTAKTMLPTLKDIKEFSRETGLPEIHADSRQKAVSSVINSMVKFSNKEILTKIQSITKYKSGYRTLEGWGNIILNGKDSES